MREAYGAGILTNVFSIPSDNIFSSNSYYTITFNTATTGTIKTIEIKFPIGFNVAAANLIEVQGIGAGSLSVVGQVVKYTVSSPVSVPAPRAIKIMIADVTNAVTLSNQISVVTKDNSISSGVIDGPTNSALFKLIQITNPMISTGAVTATKIGADAIDSSKIKNGQIGNSDIANSAINSDKLADNSVSTNCSPNSPHTCTSKLADYAVTQSKIRTGAVIPHVSEYKSTIVVIPAKTGGVAVASCINEGEVATGGGFYIEPANGKVIVEQSIPNGTREWLVLAYNTDIIDRGILAKVLCMRLLP